MGWKKFAATSLLALSLASAPAASVLAAPAQKNVDALVQVFTLLVDTHYSHPKEEDVLNGAVQGMLQAVHDPYNDYFTPQEYAEFVGAINQTYAGIGVGLRGHAEGQLVIDHVYADSPAAKAGLQEGDAVLQVDDIQVTPDTLNEATQQLRGQAGTQVQVTIQRDGERKDLTITRAEIELPTVLSYRMEDGVGYIRLFSFGDRTAYEFHQALKELQTQNISGLVLDLRGNGGGLVLSALEIADTFLGEGTLLYVKGEDGEPIALEGDAQKNELPLAVLVDDYSASASEILAGALQKGGRAKLIGAQTFGKGTMQLPTELPNGGYLKVSVDKWEFRDGTSNHEVGLTPDIRLTRPEAAANAAVQTLLPDRLQTLVYERSGNVGMLNGIELIEVPDLVMERGRVYLPLRYTFESLGSEVRWVPEENAVAFQLDGSDARIDLAAQRVTVDGQPLAVENAIRSINGSTYISEEAVSLLTKKPLQITDKQVIIQAQ